MSAFSLQLQIPADCHLLGRLIAIGKDTMKPALILLLLGVCLAAPAYSDTAVVNTPGDGFLALRSEPSTKQGSRLVKIPHGTVLILGECVRPSASQTWCKTSYAGHAGWVLETYINRSEDAGASQSDADQRAILSMLQAVCTPDWCRPSVDRVMGRYATGFMECTKQNCESATAYFMKKGGTWELVDYGTGISTEDLIGYGFPADVARTLAW